MSDEESKLPLRPEPAERAPLEVSEKPAIIVFSVSAHKARQTVVNALWVLLLPLFVVFAPRWHHQYLRGEIAQLLSDKLPALAAERIDPYRSGFVSSAEDCALLLNSYEGAYRFARLHWAAESCVRSKVHSLEVLTAFGVIYQEKGELLEARLAFARAAHTFKKPEAIVRLAYHLLRMEEPDKALYELENGLRNQPTEELLAWNAIKLGVETKQYERAGAIAEKWPRFFGNPKYFQSSVIMEKALKMSGRSGAIPNATGLIGTGVPGMLKR